MQPKYKVNHDGSVIDLETNQTLTFDDPNWIAYRAEGKPFLRDMPAMEITPLELIEEAAQWGMMLVREIEAAQMLMGVNNTPGAALALSRLFREPRELLVAGLLHAAYDSLQELLGQVSNEDALTLVHYVIGRLQQRIGGDRN